jgi:NAD(P)-dependent dehydrogenase (short-subunit alcohol dehydrogenase family)
MKTNWTTANIPSQAGRRALITGANSGIGFEAALALAGRGAELILPARTQAKADDAAARILEQVPNAQLHPEMLDLAVQASVRAFADRVIEGYPTAVTVPKKALDEAVAKQLWAATERLTGAKFGALSGVA